MKSDCFRSIFKSGILVPREDCQVFCGVMSQVFGPHSCIQPLSKILVIVSFYCRFMFYCSGVQSASLGLRYSLNGFVQRSEAQRSAATSEAVEGSQGTGGQGQGQGGSQSKSQGQGDSLKSQGCVYSCCASSCPKSSCCKGSRCRLRPSSCPKSSCPKSSRAKARSVQRQGRAGKEVGWRRKRAATHAKSSGACAGMYAAGMDAAIA